jgi:hypothetical protein
MRTATGIVVLALLCGSAYLTAPLAYDYITALLGTPEAQWQFAFMLVPAPSLLALLALLITWLAKPPHWQWLAYAAGTAIAIPLLLLGLVRLHLY